MTLFLTLSRGGMLAFGVSLLAWGALLVERHGARRTWQELTQNRLLLAGLIGLVLLGTVGVVESGFATRVVRRPDRTRSAADAHQSSMAYSVGFIAEHPLGIGMGMVGERALQFANEAQIEHTESTFLQTAMELGLFGLGLLLAALLALLLTLWRMRAHGDVWVRAAAELALVLWIGAMADFVFTPLLQNSVGRGLSVVGGRRGLQPGRLSRRPDVAPLPVADSA